MSFRQALINKLKTDLYHIKRTNGYETNVKEVYLGTRNFDQINEYPSISFFIDNPDTILGEDESGYFNIRQCLLKIFVYVRSGIDPEQKGTATELLERYFVDIARFMRIGNNGKDGGQGVDYTAPLSTLQDYEDYKVNEKHTFIENEEGRGAAYISFLIQYKELDSEYEQNVSATNNIANA